ncbi:hypothetical protein UFOVP700_16 [uncultured Caudovirales phage]|uniref:Uncharacterized protein n=1 Tax=uncultured Caudovirales phage TaxID=2100421 RepID=A0A6J5NIB4_9CAUD|nr:hypothetical protein UFOVP700_16 [uncultured Caudovirales phage]
MTNRNFRVRHGLEVDGNIEATDLTLSGNLTVNGTTTTINTDTLSIEDNIVVLNSNVTGTPTTDAGIEVERGTSTNSAITWQESDDKWYQNRGGTLTVIPVSTSELAEGSNEYFTTARARSSVSVTNAGGEGSLSYNNTTGVFTYTGPSGSPNVTGGTGVTVTAGTVAIGQAVGTGDNVSFAGVTAGNLTVGLADNNTITSTDTNGNIALAPNGTGIVTVSTATDTNITDGNYVTGVIWGTRNTAFSIPTTVLTTLSGTNGFQAVSSSGYAANIGITHYNNDTTASFNAAPTLVFRNAGGTNSAPSAVPVNNVIMSINGDGYATTDWASSIATTGVGGGTAALSPIQMQFYAREAFASSGGNVTNAGAGFRIRGFQTATQMSAANRLVFIDHHANAATYKTNTFNVQPSTSTMNYLTLGASSGIVSQDTFTIRNSLGTNIYGIWDSNGYTARRTVTGTPGVAESRPGFLVELSRSDQTTPNNGDSISFRQRVRGSNNTFYTVSDLAARYSTTGDHEYSLQLANGDQTTGSFSGLNTFTSSITQTRIRAGTASATPGASSVNDIIIANNSRVTLTRPLELRASGGNTIEFSAGSTPSTQTYVLPQAYPVSEGRVLASDGTGTMSWTVPGISTTTQAGNFAGGSVYTPAATVNTTIRATINSGTGGLEINVTNLLVANQGGTYLVRVGNTSGAAQTVSTTNAQINATHNLADGATMLVIVRVVDGMAFCEHQA